MEAFLKTGKLGQSVSSSSHKEKPTSGKKQAQKPWVEKYRPRTVDDVAYQDEVVAVLKKSLQGMDLQNLLFYGPPGTGKTSTILAASRDLFGDIYRDRVLELNASDERGIQVIREKVKNFAQLTASGTRPDGKPCPPFKIVILDEADSMTTAAQDALRRTMEKQSKSTRFCLICNYVTRITEPLTSRCSKFRFRPLAKEVLIGRLRHICEEEGVKCEDGALEALMETSEGDLRKAIMSLQSAARLKGEEGFSAADVYEIMGVIPDKWITELLEKCRMDSYEKLEQYVQNMMCEGFSGSQLMTQVHEEVVNSPDMTDKQKSRICDKLAICDHRLMEGADEYLQIMDLCCTLMKEMCHGS